MNSPGDYVRDELKHRGWGQNDLATIIKRPVQRVSELVLGKLALSPEWAIDLATALGGTPEEWLHREANYRLSLAKASDDDVRRRARLYELGPIKEMQKRGWITAADSVEELEASLVQFLELPSIADNPRFSGVQRKSGPSPVLTLSQQAWCFRIRNIAKRLPSIPFKKSRIAECRASLRKLAAYSAHTAKVSELLSMFGIRFVVAEPLSGGKIDGVATWLDENSPVIGLSMRYERIDNFWHNIFHEMSHIEHEDESVDTELNESPSEARPAFEKRADEDAAATLVPKRELGSFIKLYGPIYSTEVINQFANKLKIHPGVIVGQLQHLGEVPYSKFRDTLVKVRDIVTRTAVTDGWGRKLDSRRFE
jgi:HTH-type transcriptional regulator/antitoxin HigA